jgi:hypothetical protein
MRPARKRSTKYCGTKIMFLSSDHPLGAVYKHSLRGQLSPSSAAHFVSWKLKSRYQERMSCSSLLPPKCQTCRIMSALSLSQQKQLTILCMAFFPSGAYGKSERHRNDVRLRRFEKKTREGHSCLPCCLQCFRRRWHVDVPENHMHLDVRNLLSLGDITVSLPLST